MAFKKDASPLPDQFKLVLRKERKARAEKFPETIPSAPHFGFKKDLGQIFPMDVLADPRGGDKRISISPARDRIVSR